MSLSVLMFGRTGQVATEVQRRAPPGTSVMALDRRSADLTDPAACAAIVRDTGADVVLNAAAFTGVDRAETEPDLAQLVNAEAPGAIARAAAARDLPFVHISTDYVFDGSGTRPWSEDDRTRPLGVYGRTKLGGEQAVQAAGGRHVILRTSWVFSAHGSNFVRTMLGLRRDTLGVVDDQHGGPTAAADIADAVLGISAAFGGGCGQSGIYHFSGYPDTTWCGFASEIFARSARTAPPRIEAISTDQYPTPAQRPANSRLDCRRIGQVYGLERPDWQRSLDAVLTELKEAGQ